MELEVVGSDFNSLVHMTSYKGDVYVVEQVGIVYKITNERVVPWMDLTKTTLKLNSKYDERGLLSIDFHPQRKSVYLFYSIPGPKNKYFNCVSSFPFNYGEIIYKEEIVHLRILKDEDIHNGGTVQFGPDGYLYVSSGDDGPQKDPRNHGQKLDVIYGKILRMHPDRTKKNPLYPLDNPFVNIQGADPNIYAYGFRNPWKISFDDQGNLFAGDVGYNDKEEVDIVEKGGNYGWNLYEGTMPTPWTTNQERRKIRHIPPIYEYQHLKGASAIIGGYYVNGLGYIFGDVSGEIYVIDEEDGRWQLKQKKKINAYIKSFGKVGNDLFVLTSEKMGPEGDTSKIQRILFN